MYKDLVCASSYAMYRKDERGFLPELMDKMYIERKAFKGQMLKSKQKLVDIESRDEETRTIMTQRITPETYQKMNDEFEKEGVPLELMSPPKNKLTNGCNNPRSSE